MNVTYEHYEHNFDLGGSEYAALNCRNGIIACLIRDFRHVDVTPVYASLHLSLSDVMEPVRRAEIAGGHIGNFGLELWTALFSVRWYKSVVEPDVTEFRHSIANTLRRVGPVLAPHDGYFDETATDKFGRVHMIHNSMIYGASDNGSTLMVADRHFRSEMNLETFHRSLLAQDSSLIGVTAAKPYDGSWQELASSLLRSIAENSTTAAHRDLIPECIAAVNADGPGTNDARWRQTYSCLKSVGVSRLFSVRLLTAAQRHGARLPEPETTQLSTHLSHWADEWSLVSAISYKYMMTGQKSYLTRIANRLNSLIQAEAAEMSGLAIATMGLP
ncbi:MAG: hypothetical protein LBK42_06980 [Propionibacteriaceae bacterium]|jgi:hypothetical protein|nr:hypothetical protein [Propionibacteriaceae bacterium]